MAQQSLLQFLYPCYSIEKYYDGKVLNFNLGTKSEKWLQAVAEINAKSLYPVHTEHPEAYNAVSKNLILIKEGLEYKL